MSNIPGETQTLPSAIYTFTQVPGGEAGAMRLALVSIAISMLALLCSEAMALTPGRKVFALVKTVALEEGAGGRISSNIHQELEQEKT